MDMCQTCKIVIPEDVRNSPRIEAVTHDLIDDCAQSDEQIIRNSNAWCNLWVSSQEIQEDMTSVHSPSNCILDVCLNSRKIGMEASPLCAISFIICVTILMKLVLRHQLQNLLGLHQLRLIHSSRMTRSLPRLEFISWPLHHLRLIPKVSSSKMLCADAQIVNFSSDTSNFSTAVETTRPEVGRSPYVCHNFPCG